MTFSYQQIADGGDPAAALTAAAPFVITPGNNALMHELGVAQAAVLGLTAVAGQNISVQFQRSIGGLDTHTGDYRILRMFARAV